MLFCYVANTLGYFKGRPVGFSSFSVRLMCGTVSLLQLIVVPSPAAFRRSIQLVNFNEFLTVYKFAVPNILS